jgi:phospholipid/cholesterol/gamma-HCH transport system substrate-binding protein
VNLWNTETKVGLVVFIGLAFLGILLMTATDSPWTTGGDNLSVYFNHVSDLRVGARVQLSGVPIGKVTDIKLIKAENKVEVKMSIKDAFEWLKEGCELRIDTIGFVGEAYVAMANGPVTARLLTPIDLPLAGKDTLRMSDIFDQTLNSITKATQLIDSANKFMQENQTNVSEGITEIRNLTNRTTQALERVASRTEETLTTFNRITVENDLRFQQTLRQVNRLIGELENDAQVLTSYAGDITRTVYDLVHRNVAPAEETISNMRASSSELRQVVAQLRRDFNVLNNELSALISESRNIIDTERPKVDQILGNLASSTERLDKLQNNLNEFLEKVQYGDGSVAQLVNNPDVFNEARMTLNAVNDTMTSFRELSQTLDQKSDQLKLPSRAWDYELRYLGRDKSLHTEIAFLLLPTVNQRYRFGLGVRHEDVKFEFQYNYDFNDHFRARAGFMRSRPGAGFDIWLLSRRLGLTVEGTRLTSRYPELNTELTFKLLPYGHIVIGAENLTNEIRYTAGFRIAARNW